VYNETINCFHECSEFGLLRGKFKRYVEPHFSYVNNTRWCNNPVKVGRPHQAPLANVEGEWQVRGFLVRAVGRKWGEEFPSFGDKSSAVWEEFQVRLKYLALKTVMVTCIGP
jgi:hypothetical protein